MTHVTSLPKINSTTQRKKLVYAHRILAHLKLDDHIYTHVSIRSQHGFFIGQFGYRFEEMEEHFLAEICESGERLNANFDLNKTGEVIHGAVYAARPDVNAVIHLHTPSIIAVSSLEEGLMPLSQWALHFYENVRYHNYDALALEGDIGTCMVRDLGDKSVLMLRNHGVLIAAESMEEAVYYAYFLELACKTQCMTLAMNRPLITPNHTTCIQARDQLLSFEPKRGMRDWDTWVRTLAHENKLPA